MKKQNKIIIGIILGIAVVIILISFLFPSVYKGLTSGSFGKADKYRQEQMSESDIHLRSEFVQDTAKLRQMITGLIYYALFTENLSMTIDTCLTSFNLQGFDKNPANAEAIHLLTDYSSFIKNNNTTVANTTRMLAAFLLRDTIAQSMDIEKNLKDFSIYVSKVNEKDSVLTIALARIDSYLIGNKTLQKKDAEIRNLKAIRDQLVIKSTQFMALTGNKQGIGAMLNCAMQSQLQFSGIGALNIVVDGGKLVQSNLGMEENLSRINSSTLCAGFNASTSLQGSMANAKDNLGNNGGSAVSAKMNLVYVCSKENLSVVLYDKPSLSFVVGSSEKLIGILGMEKMNGILCGTDPSLGALCVIYGKNLSVTLNAGLLANLSSSPTLCAALSAATLNVIIPAKELSAVNANFNAIGSNAPLQMGYCGSQSLIGMYAANTSLSGLLNSNSVFSGFSSLQATSLNSQLNVR